jgi:hypothetical protein
MEPVGKTFDIGYNIISAERKMKYGTEAVGIIVFILYFLQEHVKEFFDV